MGSDMDVVLKHTKLIIWDEAPMQHRHCIEALNCTLRDLFKNDKDFGGITVLMLGDFHQTLPVIPKGSRGQIVNASIRRSRLWANIEVLHLTQNRCLEQTPESQAFAAWLLEVSDG